MRIGVYVCECGVNISATVDVEKVVKYAKSLNFVKVSRFYKYMCSSPGQQLIKDDIKKYKLDRIVVASCSPRMHEKTFRDVIEEAGLNRYVFEMANIREQCSWVHKDRKKATKKAKALVSSAVNKVALLKPLDKKEININQSALVIGGGIAGMQTALDIANSGYEVYLVERKSSIGGHMAQLSETFPTLDCAQCILTPKMVEVSKHKRIHLITYAEIEEVKGFVGNFKIKIKKKAKFVNWDKCTGCGLCQTKCPTKTQSEFERYMGKRKAIYTPFPQAVPNKPVIDSKNCLYFKKGKCGVCKKICPVDAVDYEQKEEIIEIETGAIVVATGFDLMSMDRIGEYGYGKYRDVIDSLQFERLLSASGPTSGEIRRPSDGKIPKEVVFIQCAGSRDPEHNAPYCSKICCMYTAKHATLYKHAVHDGQTYVFYIDIRSAGKGYEEFVQRGIEEEDILYLRGKVSKVFEEGDKIIVWGVDTLTGKKIEIEADLVVLAMASIPTVGTEDLANKLKISTNEFGFLNEAHAKLRPLETMTSGIFIAGCSQFIKDIPETVAQASGAASRVCEILSNQKMEIEPLIAVVNESECRGCGYCLDVCPYDAIEMVEINSSENNEKVARVNEALCKGCGSCVAACLSGSIQVNEFTDEQLLSTIKSLGGITE